jgi:predicted phosphodiesterase
LKRLAKREEHPTIAPDADHYKILMHYFDKFETPSSNEYDEIERIEKRVYADIYDVRKFIKDKFIIIGDIHGCYNEFMQLLEKCGYQDGDTVISVGDLIDRGPYSRKVLEWFRMNDGFVVEGNHDNRFRRWLAGRPVKMKHGLKGTIGEFPDFNDDDHTNIMQRYQLLRWMNKWPHIIRIPNIDGKRMYVVHAGLDGRWPVTRQKVETCLYARYLGGKDFFDEENGIPWYSTLGGDYKVVSGHMIHKDPFINKNAVLLDGGAYKGGVLRGLINGVKLVEIQSKNYEKMDK